MEINQFPSADLQIDTFVNPSYNCMQDYIDSFQLVKPDYPINNQYRFNDDDTDYSTDIDLRDYTITLNTYNSPTTYLYVANLRIDNSLHRFIISKKYTNTCIFAYNNHSTIHTHSIEFKQCFNNYRLKINQFDLYYIKPIENSFSITGFLGNDFIQKFNVNLNLNDGNMSIFIPDEDYTFIIDLCCLSY